MVGACLLGFVVLCLAATSGPSTAFVVPARDLPARGEDDQPQDSGAGSNPWDFWTGAGEPRMMEQWFGVVLAILFTVLVVVAVVLLVRSVVLANRLRKEQWEERPVTKRRWNKVQAAIDVEEASVRALAALAEGHADDAVTAYWQAVQAAAAEAGLPREAWETTTEYSTRLVESLGVSSEPTTTLAALFREVRFSSHALDDGDVERAKDALHTIRGDLAVDSATAQGAS